MSLRGLTGQGNTTGEDGEDGKQRGSEAALTSARGTGVLMHCAEDVSRRDRKHRVVPGRKLVIHKTIHIM